MLVVLVAAAAGGTGRPVASATAPEGIGPGRYQGDGDAGGVLNILPPGQDGGLNALELAQAFAGGPTPAHFEDQLGPYADLVHATPGLDDADLIRFFKDASFGVRPDDIERVYRPHPDVTVIRDRSAGVAHVYGETRFATMFAQGYTGAEDRLFLMDVLRHVGKARLSEFVGGSDSNQAMDLEQLAIAPYREADLTAQFDALTGGSPEQRRVAADLSAYAEGVTRFIVESLTDPTKLPGEYLALQKLPEPWTPEDTIAIASLVGGVFGKGGGGELRNLCGLHEISDTLGDATEALRVFDDLKFRNDPEAPTTATTPAPYEVGGTVDPDAVPDVDCATLAPIEDGGQLTLGDLLGAISGDGPGQIGPLPLSGNATGVIDLPWGQMPLVFPDAMSNAVLIGAEHTAEGVPIAVFGPQTGYFTPQLLVEKDVHGPGIDARGVAFAGTDIWVQLGRGGDYAWSATSAGSDNVDQWVLRLCEPGGGPPTTTSLGYEHDGGCVPIETYQHTQVAVPTAGGLPGGPDDILLSWRVERTPDYGPLVARGTLTDGTPIAVATQRSTYGSELESAVGFSQINDPEFMAEGYPAFRRAFGDGVQYTFNWFYIDAEDIGYQHSCKCPTRATGADPHFPNWGDGTFDWAAFVDYTDQPNELNPASGYLTSWNNKPAPLWRSADDDFSSGPVYRSLALDNRVKSRFADGVEFTRATGVDVAEDAGTVDVRGESVLPTVLAVLGPTAPADLDPRLQDMRDRLAAWAPTGAHRRDRDANGAYDDPQPPAILDAWWERLAHTIFDEPSGGAIDALGLKLHDPPQLHIGSAFNGSFYGQVEKDLRTVLGASVDAPFHREYCGDGDLAACRRALWESLAATAAALQDEFDSAAVADWRRTIADDELRHRPLVVGVDPIHWINRPTFQQVVQLGVPAVPLPPEPPTTPTTSPPTSPTTSPPTSPTTTVPPTSPTTEGPPADRPPASRPPPVAPPAVAPPRDGGSSAPLARTGAETGRARVTAGLLAALAVAMSAMQVLARRRVADRS